MGLGVKNKTGEKSFQNFLLLAETQVHNYSVMLPLCVLSIQHCGVKN